jgi:hypothetical protein
MAANSATIAINSTANGPALHGAVQAAGQPVVGSSVALYAAGTTGYASAATQVFAPGGSSTFLTDANGNFTVPAGYTCASPTSQMYLVAQGGKVGGNAANANLALMTALGSCGNLGSAPVVLNEVTSVASAYATAPFASNDALNGNSSYLYLGTSSGNSQGLANAFAAVNNLADISTGQVRFTVPAGNAAVPYVEINTLADILNACTNSGGGVEGDGSACSTLFTYADVLPDHTLYAPAPSDTLQAIFNIAQRPASNYGYLLSPQNSPMSLVTFASPFQPVLQTLPGDWSISLNYTGGGGLSTTSVVGSFAMDAAGNLWISDTKNASVAEWNTVGAALSPATGFPAGGGPVAIDATGNVWVSGNGSLTELNSIGTQVPGSPFGGVAGGGSDMAFDAQSNLWLTTGTGVAEFNSLGVELSPSGGYVNTNATGIAAVAIDSADNVWVGGTGSDTYAVLTNPGGQLIANAGSSGNTSTALPEMAADGAGDIWSIISSDFICELKPYAGKGTPFAASCSQDGGNAYNILKAGGIALDGAGTVWVASAGGNIQMSNGNPGTLPPGLLPITPSLSPGLATNEYASPSLSAGTLRVAVDGSGNVWVLLANNTVTEYIGLATPAVTPIALGVKNKKLAAKP